MKLKAIPLFMEQIVAASNCS